jgi:hypothetical protein
MKLDAQDHSTKSCLLWKLQAFFYSNVEYGYNEQKKCWYRRVKNIRGKLHDDNFFYPNFGQLISYRIKMSINEIRKSKLEKLLK